MSEDYGFSFSLFELGLYAYAKKIGDKADFIEVQKLTDKSPILKALSSLLGSIPLFDIATKIFDLADEGISMLLTHLKQHSRELMQIEYMEAEELYNYLPYLFSCDMAKNMTNAKQPLVVFFDTYEKLVNELSQVGEPLKNDEWIRCENGIIQNIPNVLWVIGGREKLKWERFDDDWSDALEQHILGSLSFADSEQFLIGAGVGGEELRKQIYTLTKGTPVYLDLCVDQYLRICRNGTIPKIEMFGNNTFDLIERFARYMDAQQKDLVYLLSCFQRWTDDLIIEIAPKILPNFSITVYEKVKDYSFIVKSDDGYYNIHQTVGEVLLDGCPQIVKERTADYLLEVFSTKIEEQKVISIDFSSSLLYMMRAILIKQKSRDELRELYNLKIKENLQKLIAAGCFERAKSVLEIALDIAQKEREDLLYATVIYDAAIYERYKGNYEGACKFAEDAFNLYGRLLGEDHDDTISAASNLTDVLSYTNQLERLLNIDKKVFEKRKEKLGEDHPDTIIAMRKLGVAYTLLERKEEAMDMDKRVLEKCIKVFGHEHIETLKAKNNYAAILRKNNRTSEAYGLRKEVLEKRRELLGEDHPDTITAMSNFSLVVGDLEKALELKKKVLEKRRKIYGEYHRETLAAKNNLANTLDEMNNHEQAYELRLEVLEKRRELFGEDHLETVRAAHNLANSFNCKGLYEEELKLRKMVYVKRMKLLGEYNMETILSLENVADTYGNLSDSQNELDKRIEVLEKYRFGFGNNHDYTVAAMVALAENYRRLGKNEQAEALEVEALETQVKAVGENPLKTVVAMSNLATVLIGLGEFEKAVGFRRKIWGKYVEFVGFDHEKTIAAQNELQDAIKLWKNNEKA